MLAATPEKVSLRYLGELRGSRFTNSVQTEPTVNIGCRSTTTISFMARYFVLVLWPQSVAH